MKKLNLLPIIILCLSTLPLKSQEFIYNQTSFPECHATSIVQTTSGDLLVAFFGGTKERNPDCCIWLCRLSADKVNQSTENYSGDVRWSEPVLVADGVLDGVKTSCYNPVLFQVPNGELQLFYKVGPSVQEWRGFLIRSQDGGYTWSKPESFPANQLGPVRNKPIIVNGGLLCGSSFEDKGWRVHYEWAPLIDGRVSPIGEDWQVSQPINDTSDCQIIQPTLWMKADGSIQAFFRNRNAKGAIMSSYAVGKFAVDSRSGADSDAGTSVDAVPLQWTRPTPTTLPSNNSGIDGVALPDGSFLLVYNHITGDNPKARSPICYAITRDGIHWSEPVLLEDTPGMELSYPAVILTADGAVHITYTWHRTHLRHWRVEL